jgi:twitching motility two-component system response regulator PilG
MLTGREGIIDRVRARMAGCTAYLTKPFNPQELLGLVQKLAQAQPIPQI